MSYVSHYQTSPQVCIHTSQAWYVDLEVKKGACSSLDGDWRVMVLVLHRPWPHLNLIIDRLHLGQKLGDSLPLAVGGAVCTAEI